MERAKFFGDILKIANNMKLFQKLKNAVDPINSLFGFGFVKAMDYNSGKSGHLFLFSFKGLIYKLFI